MGWFEVAMFVISAAISLSQSGGRNGQPERPSYIPPDYGPLNEQSAFTAYQDKTRNKLLSEYYGGRGKNGRVTFGGEKPAEEYLSQQMAALNESSGDFSGDMAAYFAERGMDPGDQVEGAQGELAKSYAQKAKEINAKSQDIYALTLGSLFGEVSDAGAQAGQMAGLVGQASQMENQRRDQSWNQAMQRWQYEQSKPNALTTIGSLLPLLASMSRNGGGTGSNFEPSTWTPATMAGPGFGSGMNQYKSKWVQYGRE